jgi:hypothetical protein
MKRFVFFSALVLSITQVFSQSAPIPSSSNSEVVSTMKVFLSITHNNDSISGNVRTTLNSMNGANTLAYCDKHSVFMVLVDKTIFQDETIFLNEIKDLMHDNASLLTLKIGDFEAFKNDCEPSNADDVFRIKNSLNK